jgi:hypothetical protein
MCFFSRSKIADFYCFSIDKRQLEKRASMLNARTTHAFHIFDDKILGNCFLLNSFFLFKNLFFSDRRF